MSDLMNVTLFNSVILMIVGGCMVLLYNYAKVLLAEIHNKTVLKNIRERDYIREELLENTSAERISFFRTHNKDGRPSHDKDYKTTCVRGARYQERMYKDVVVDTQYTEMLLHILNHQDHYYDFITAEEPPCMLKEYYETEGVGRSLIYYIKSTKSGISYVSFAKTDPSAFTKEDRDKFKIAVERVAKLTNLYYSF